MKQEPWWQKQFYESKDDGWSPKKKTIRIIKDFQGLKKISSPNGYSENDLYYYSATGEYVRKCESKVGYDEYEVMYSPSNPAPVLGHREDMVMVDDVTTDSFLSKDAYNYWAQPIIDKMMEKRYKDLSDALTNSILYGTLSKPSGILNFGPSTSKTPAYKEKDMEIGGSVCHLCGAKLIQHNCDITYKKRNHVRNVKRYECGTIVDKGYKSAGEGYQMEEPYSKVILGDDCVEI